MYSPNELGRGEALGGSAHAGAVAEPITDFPRSTPGSPGGVTGPQKAVALDENTTRVTKHRVINEPEVELGTGPRTGESHGVE